jgi:hypothetical protein
MKMKQPARRRYFLRDYPTPNQRQIALELLLGKKIIAAARAALPPERNGNHRLARAYAFSWN